MRKDCWNESQVNLSAGMRKNIPQSKHSKDFSPQIPLSFLVICPSFVPWVREKVFRHIQLYQTISLPNNTKQIFFLIFDFPRHGKLWLKKLSATTFEGETDLAASTRVDLERATRKGLQLADGLERYPVRKGGCGRRFRHPLHIQRPLTIKPREASFPRNRLASTSLCGLSCTAAFVSLLFTIHKRGRHHFFWHSDCRKGDGLRGR